MSKKIYIAGFDVFETDSIEIGKKYVKLCQDYGFIGLYPLDNEVDFNQEKRKIASDIFEANRKMIEEADIVVANLNSFRGYEPDSGTVWECGYATGLGKKVYGYMEDCSDYIDRFSKNETSVKENYTLDKDGLIIEDFNHPINLMIACSVDGIIEGGFEDVLKAIK
ncbi:nucleoside 2-deoxyribosyltransferase [Sulfurimonas sp.]|uniref:nucleoside 2-deoxyribosyltransferase n=1 Tax=Sulfurimonas sp. TaxID=2022749 RepID=UPI00356AE2A1